MILQKTKDLPSLPHSISMYKAILGFHRSYDPPHFQLGFPGAYLPVTRMAVLEFHRSLQKMCRDMLRSEVLT